MAVGLPFARWLPWLAALSLTQVRTERLEHIARGIACLAQSSATAASHKEGFISSAHILGQFCMEPIPFHLKS